MATRALTENDRLDARRAAVVRLPVRSGSAAQIAPGLAPGAQGHPDAICPPDQTFQTATGGSFLEASRRPRLTAAVVVVALHALAIGALVTHKLVATATAQPETMLVMNIAAPPPPVTSAPAPPVLVTPAVTVPPPVIEVAQHPPAITATVASEPLSPAPAQMALPAAKGPPAAAAHQVAAPALMTSSDLSTTMVSMVAPRYPYESRRRKEEGTVVLDVQLATDGTVDKVQIRTSSGFARLDTAALDAVRRWRWSPMIRDGVAVAVRGLVEIPFLLSPAKSR